MSARPVAGPVPEPRTDADRACSARLGRSPAAQADARFAVVLNCIDGRAQGPLTDWVRRSYGVDHVDTVTEPGVDAVLAHGDEEAVSGLLDKVCVSRLAHHAGAVVVAGHHDCAAHPVDAEQHRADVARAVQRLRAALPGIEVVGAYVDESWTVQPLAGAPALPPRRWYDLRGPVARAANRLRPL